MLVHILPEGIREARTYPSYNGPIGLMGVEKASYRLAPILPLGSRKKVPDVDIVLCSEFGLGRRSTSLEVPEDYPFFRLWDVPLADLLQELCLGFLPYSHLRELELRQGLHDLSQGLELVCVWGILHVPASELHDVVEDGKELPMLLLLLSALPDVGVEHSSDVLRRSGFSCHRVHGVEPSTKDGPS